MDQIAAGQPGAKVLLHVLHLVVKILSAIVKQW